MPALTTIWATFAILAVLNTLWYGVFRKDVKKAFDLNFGALILALSLTFGILMQH